MLIENTGAATAMPEFAAVSTPPRLRDYLELIYRYKWLLLFFTTLAVLLTYLFFSLRPPESEAKVTLDLDRQAALPGASSGINSLDEFIATQAQLIKSEAVLRPVSKRYEMKSRKLKVERVGKTSLLQLKYLSADAKQASDVAGAIAAAYLGMLERNRFTAWKAASSLTEAQIADARSRMEQSEEELLRAHTGGAPLGDNSTRLEEGYGRAMSETAARQAAYESIKGGALAALLASPDAEPFRKLIERKTDATHKFNDLKQLFGENHPDYKQAQAELRTIDEEINAARQNAIQKSLASWKEAQAHESSLREELQRTGTPRRGVVSTQNYESVKQKAEADRALYQALVRKLNEAQIDAQLQNSQVRIVDPVAVESVGRHLWRNCLLALLTALPLALIVLVFGAADKTVRTLADLQATGLPILSVLPAIKSWRESLFQKAEPHLIDTAGGGTRENSYREGIDQLRDALLPRDPMQLHCVSIVSPMPREARSTLAANLAIALAEAGQKVLLIDGNLRRPALHSLFHAAPSSVGLSSVLRGEVDWKDAVRETTRPQLFTLSGGNAAKIVPGIDELVLPGMLEEAAKEFNLILIDTAPFLHNPEVVDFVKFSDGILVSTRAANTGEDSFLKLLGYLRRLDARVLGVILSDA